MSGLEKFIGEALDGKYRLERLLGRGGMGAVYLATHLGTERPVALKLIAPQFMRNDEFVERFKREARAAGRLRHPNVVDVTDFGFAQVGAERVAYLVMEYLDGCTLGDVLAEEPRLPLDWSVDILEQVCSAVDEAHQQGIVHRDLKPDNIWLEPNRLGGYRVKVLDFGIAKLAEADAAQSFVVAAAGDSPGPTDGGESAQQGGAHPAQSAIDAVQASIARVASSLQTSQAKPAGGAAPTPRAGGEDAEAATQIYAPSGDAPRDDDASDAPAPQPGADYAVDDQQTRILDAPPPARGERAAHATAAAASPRQTEVSDDADGTRLFDSPRAAAGAGARGLTQSLTASATSALTRVGSIMGTPLYMSPEQCRGERLDARADIYSLGVIAYQMLAGETPFTGDMVSVMRQHTNDEPPPLRAKNKKVPKRAARIVMSALAKNPPVRPPSAAAFANALRANSDGVGALYRRAFALYSEHFPKFLRLSFIAHAPVIVLTLALLGLQLAEHSLPKIVLLIGVLVVALLLMVAYFLAAATISGVTAIMVAQIAVAPMRPVQLRTAFAVLKRRWRPFLSTSLRITIKIIIGFICLFIPGLVISTRNALYAPVVLMENLEKKAALKRARALAARSWRTVIIVSLLQFAIPMLVSFLLGRFSVSAHRETASTGVKISQNLSGLFNIFVVPLMSIVPALLYIRMRQMGGESLNEVIAQIEEVEAVHTGWQRRMRERLSGYTPQSGSRIARPSHPSDPSRLG
ncbi:MAG TPA: protein kinase [Pyrinomonadaceae bacterium]|jgi:serine/threonine protein kinase